MSDPILTNLLREYLEASPPRGLEKLVEGEMNNLCEALSEFVMEVYDRGYGEGFDDCMETFKEGAKNLFGVEV